MHCFDEEIHSLVEIFVSARGEKIERAVEIETVAREEMPHYKFVNALLVLPMQMLKFVHGLETLNVQPIGQNRVGMPAQEFFCFDGGYFGDGGKHGAGMCRGAR